MGVRELPELRLIPADYMRIQDMAPPYKGGCVCGEVRYTVRENPLLSYCCHCTACQRRTGSAFGISMQVRTEALTVDQGSPKTRIRVADSGNELGVNFCDLCGTVLYSVPQARPHLRVVYAGTLDDPGWVPIQLNIWADSALPWVYLDPDIERIPGQPDLLKYI